MTRTKLIGAVILILGLGGICLYMNRDSFARAPIQITHRASPWLEGRRPKRLAELGTPVVFSFNNFYEFTEIKVVRAAEAETNKYAPALWNLISESNSIPLTSLTYGQGVRGMRPATKGDRPDPLESGVNYRLMVKTTKGDAQHDFTADLPQR